MVELATAASSAELVLVLLGAVVTVVVTFEVAERDRFPEAMMLPLSIVTDALEFDTTAPIFTNPLKRLTLWLLRLTVEMAERVIFWPVKNPPFTSTDVEAFARISVPKTPPLLVALEVSMMSPT